VSEQILVQSRECRPGRISNPFRYFQQLARGHPSGRNDERAIPPWAEGRELKIEFQELIRADGPIEISGFTLDEIDQIVLGEAIGG
jgi:hypothetical protein